MKLIEPPTVCPFCLHEKAVPVQRSTGKYCIRCPDCKACGPQEETKWQAIEAWESAAKIVVQHWTYQLFIETQNVA